MSAAACPRCGAGVDAGQDYCIDCGVHLAGTGRLGPAPAPSVRAPVLALLAVAAAGAALAVWLTWESDEAEPVTTALGGSVTAPQPATVRSLATWPPDRRGWTVVLASVPKPDGRQAAVALAERARARGLTRVGVLDSNTATSLHPGYWVVFAGRYDTEPEATSALQRARRAVGTAETQRITPAGA